METVNRF